MKQTPRCLCWVAAPKQGNCLYKVTTREIQGFVTLRLFALVSVSLSWNQRIVRVSPLPCPAHRNFPLVLVGHCPTA